MKCIVKETNEGNIVLHELNNDVESSMTFDTLEIHKEIWKKNFLDKEIQEEKNFRIMENHLEDELFHLIALPIFSSNEFLNQQ